MAAAVESEGRRAAKLAWPSVQVDWPCTSAIEQKEKQQRSYKTGRRAREEEEEKRRVQEEEGREER